MTSISTGRAPKPVANYSQARRKGNIVQVAGQVGIDPATGEVVAGDVGSQTRQVLANIEAILDEAGASMTDVVMLRVYLTEPAHFAEMNAAYNALVPEPFPARTTVYVGLPPGFLVEIDAMAVLG
ncbi:MULTISPECIES: RidA family protein [Prauserella salsuginis group]|uniref:Reactive intermediate/imine deaminase n=2 Tax=Prauserella salsuginis group TaxID=2893672 RepID=A0A839XQ48_9PSEU|nr:MULTISPECIES: RidA family protein [Prauserella salsuginis group]MBB3665360.1 reactive intermediate/imine deaminase [Prauserella sediminis]MCR3722320.1 reactive intermediate/imine deaminase [Prauserella flava]MCR3736318.1 reactive intermediate/imine deaminase [Prauserella salsuginis]